MKIYFQTSYLLLQGRCKRPGAWGAPEGPKYISDPPQRPSSGRKMASPRPNAPAGAQNGFAPPQRPGWGENWLRTAPERPGAPRPGAHHNTDLLVKLS